MRLKSLVIAQRNSGVSTYTSQMRTYQPTLTHTHKWGFYQSNSDDASNNHKSIRELREQEWKTNIHQIACSLERGTTTFGRKWANHYGHDYNKECMEGINGMIMKDDQPTRAPQDYSHPHTIIRSFKYGCGNSMAGRIKCKSMALPR